VEHPVLFRLLQQIFVRLLKRSRLADRPKKAVMQTAFDQIILQTAPVEVKPADIPRVFLAAVVPLALHGKIQHRLSRPQLIDHILHFHVPSACSHVMNVEIVQGPRLPEYAVTRIVPVKADRFGKTEKRHRRKGQQMALPLHLSSPQMTILL